MVSASAALAADTSAYIMPESTALQRGREIWLGTCENCHGYGVADAPIPMRPDEWQQRVTKQRSLLYTHAIEGYIGPDYSMMPARGGNDSLNDDQVKAAVDYMLFLATYYIEHNRGEK
jgi:cytochrome c5